jgi:ribonuclease R
LSHLSDEKVSFLILEQLKNAQDQNLSIKQLIKKLDFTSDQRRRVRRLLGLLTQAGKVSKEGRGRYKLVGPREEIEGTLISRNQGWYSLEQSDGSSKIRIHPDQSAAALPGDRVRAIIVRKRKQGNSEGRVEEILARGGLPIVGTFQDKGKFAQVVPDDPKIGGPFLVDRKQAGSLSEGDVVAVKVDDIAQRKRPHAKIVKILGEPGKLSTEVARLQIEYHLEQDFPNPVKQEAKRLSLKAASGSRVDLRAVPLVTIDPPHAKDFDDAVFVERAGNGYRLLVSIADVAAFVAPGSAIDREALRRGCSVYLPGTVYPMLPAGLSEDLCSLAPGQDRLAMTVELQIDSKGDINSAKFFRSLMRSSHRFSYAEVQDVLDGKTDAGKKSHQRDMLENMSACARLLLANMARRGALDLDLIEHEIHLDQSGFPENVKPCERYFANRIVEMFMIAANEAVARLMAENVVPAVYRVHSPPDPERIESFLIMAENLAAKAPFAGVPSPLELNDYLESLEGRPVKAVLSQLLLRSLMQARYSPDCDGHYGLASQAYLHFTSPIRRYPDLVVHRQLGSLIDQAENNEVRSAGRLKQPPNWPVSRDLAVEVSEQSSRTERQALAAERAAISLYQAAYMQDYISHEFEGTVSFVADFGVFVKLLPSGIEGMVHISNMKDDYYRYVEDRLSLVGRRSGKSYSMGVDVRVRIESVRLYRPQIDLSFC